MDWQLASAVVGVLVVPGCVVIWAVRLEGRQSGHERECLERQKRADERHMDMIRRLEHLDSKIDRLLNER